LKSGPTTEELAEIKALRKEVADQRRTIEILKAATTYFAKEADPRPRWWSRSSRSIGTMACDGDVTHDRVGGAHVPRSADPHALAAGGERRCREAPDPSGLGAELPLPWVTADLQAAPS
jgi:hypothetical protein